MRIWTICLSLVDQSCHLLDVLVIINSAEKKNNNKNFWLSVQPNQGQEVAKLEPEFLTLSVFHDTATWAVFIVI